MNNFKDRYQYSESVGGSTIMSWTKAKEGKVNFYKPPKNGEGAIDIIPYIIATDKHPLVRKKKMKIGDIDYMLDIFVHRGVGGNNQDCICLKMNYNEKCPICEFAQDRMKQFTKEDAQYKTLRAKRRCFYNVLDATKEEATYYVFDVSHFLFEKEVLDEAKAVGQKKGLNILDYADPENGYSILFRTSTEKMGGYDTTKFKRIDFQKREFKITEKMISKALPLDSFLIIQSYKELEMLLYGDEENIISSDEEESQPEEKQTQEEPPIRRRSESEETPTKKRNEPEEASSKKKVEKEEAPIRRKAESEETPVRRRVVETDEKPNMDPSEEPDREVEPDLDEESEQNEQPQRGRHSEVEKKDNPCPFGHQFGVDRDSFNDCNQCDVWDKCRTASRKK